MISTRSRNALIGLAIGDAMSWPAMFHRGYQYPFWTRRLRREMDAASEDSNVITPQMPFSLNQPPDGFAIGPTDDSEWVVFLMQALLGVSAADFGEASLSAWLNLAADDAGVRGSVGTQAALHNLRRNVRPPHSGHDNPHYFDSTAALRVVPLAAYFAGDPEKAAEAAMVEAHVTNSADGLWSAQAVAASLSVGIGGGSVTEVIAEAQKQLPQDSLAGRTVAAALDASSEAGSLLDLCFALSNNVVNREYNYGNAAHEVLAVALALFQFTRGNLELAILGANAVAKVADGAAPLAGAFCGCMADNLDLSATHGAPSGIGIAESLRSLPGVCVPSTKGIDYIEQVERWVAFCSSRDTQ